MFVDAHNLFSSAQAVTAAAASTNLIDLGAAVRDIGAGENLYIVLVVTTTSDDSGDDSTVTVTLETDTTAAFSSAATAQTLFTIAANAAAGTVYKARIAPGVVLEQFIRLKYTPNNGDLSAGAFTAFIAKDVDQFRAYADAITITG